MSKDIVAGFREVIQDLLVPELKALRAEFVAFKEEVRKEFGQVDKRFEQLFTELKSMRQDIEELKIAQAQNL
ncbi:MAG: hypothetical protein QME68_08625 [Elusimicrobiota bacterium]|nr:hypothetical protein [Elusimicrobiota bacterium]